LVPLPKGPAKFFRLSPDEREALGGFAVRRGDARVRLDVNYSALGPSVEERLARARYPVVTIGEVEKRLQYGCSKRADVDPVGLPILRMSNMQPDGWDLSDLKYVELTDKERDLWMLENGDILFNRTNSKELVGKCEVFREPGEWVFASYLMRLKVNTERASPDFVSAYLSSPGGRAQIERESRQIIGMTNINAEEIRTLRIPLPDPEIQATLLEDLDAARKGRDAGLAAADLALDGLDAFILDKLGVKLAPPHNDAPFAVNRASLLKGGKISPNYCNPDRRHAVGELQKAGSDLLDNLVQFVREQRTITPDDVTYVGLANVRSNTGEYVEADDDVGGKVAVFAKGDVLFAKLRPYLNKVWVADRAGVCSPEFHVLRLLPDGPVVSPEYLAAALRSSPTLTQTKRMMTGNTHPRLAPEDVGELVVPTPSPATQQSIATEVDKRRAEARRLRAVARDEWAMARQAFEEALLGPAT
jgi:type I restriction enzyme, S subunit